MPDYQLNAKRPLQDLEDRIYTSISKLGEPGLWIIPGAMTLKARKEVRDGLGTRDFDKYRYTIAIGIDLGKYYVLYQIVEKFF